MASVIPRAQLWEVCLPTAEAKLRRCCGVAAPLASNGRPPFRPTRGADVQVGKDTEKARVFWERWERFERRKQNRDMNGKFTTQNRKHAWGDLLSIISFPYWNEMFTFLYKYYVAKKFVLLFHCLNTYVYVTLYKQKRKPFQQITHLHSLKFKSCIVALNGNITMLLCEIFLWSNYFSFCYSLFHFWLR